jgi:hypothetical protein
MYARQFLADWLYSPPFLLYPALRRATRRSECLGLVIDRLPQVVAFIWPLFDFDRFVYRAVRTDIERIAIPRFRGRSPHPRGDASHARLDFAGDRSIVFWFMPTTDRFIDRHWTSGVFAIEV